MNASSDRCVDGVFNPIDVPVPPAERVRNHLEFYFSKGLRVVPLDPNASGVQPLIRWKERQLRSMEEAEEWLGRTDRFAVVCGPTADGELYLVVLDVDSEEVFKELNLDELAAETYTEFRRTGKGRRFHIFLFTDKPVGNRSLQAGGKEELGICGNKIVVRGGFPHPKGGDAYERYPTSPEKIQRVEPEYFDEIKRRWCILRGEFREEEPVRVWGGETPPCIARILEGVKQGQRNERGFDLCRFFYHSGVRGEALLKKMLEWNERNDPPLRESEIRSIVKSVERYGYKFGCHHLREAGFCKDDVCSLRRCNDKREVRRRAFFEHEGRLYLGIRTSDGEYKFAFREGGVVRFTDRIETEKFIIKPLELEEREGKVYELVKLPDEGIATCELLSADELFSKIKEHLRKYLDHSELDLELETFYIIFTWFYQKVQTLPYLRFLGDTGVGKSRAMSVVGDLCFYPIFLSGASSFSGIFRTAEKWRGTLLIDEADLKGDKEAEVIKYCNLGTERGRYFVKSDKQNPKQQEPFDPFMPKIFAMRQPFRDNALEGRLLSISPRETTREDIPILLPKSYHEETARLRNEIARFVLEHWDEVDDNKLISFTDLDIEPRMKQMAMPLSIIFQLLPDGEEVFRNYLKERQKELRKERATSWEGMLFNYILAVARGEERLEEFKKYYDPESMEIQAITPEMVAAAFKGVTKKSITQTLKSIGFEVKNRRITLFKEERHRDDHETESKTVRCYVVPDERIWRQMLRRYYDGDDDTAEVPLPECLRPPHAVTLVTDVTLPTDTEESRGRREGGVNTFMKKSVTSPTITPVTVTPDRVPEKCNKCNNRNSNEEGPWRCDCGVVFEDHAEYLAHLPHCPVYQERQTREAAERMKVEMHDRA